MVSENLHDENIVDHVDVSGNFNIDIMIEATSSAETTLVSKNYQVCVDPTSMYYQTDAECVQDVSEKIFFLIVLMNH